MEWVTISLPVTDKKLIVELYLPTDCIMLWRSMMTERIESYKVVATRTMASVEYYSKEPNNLLLINIYAE